FYSVRDSHDRHGFRDILVTEATHPFVGNWWPPGHLIGYEHTFVHTVADFVRAVVTRKSVQPTFEDGLRNQQVLDAISLSAKERRAISISR
ncbi:MAG: gfo/Idh/MocA family oxidoreductase, partial [Verrucomicrobiota bacterium]|nr:gfo/Idh/MocA family oxidoreductase [Verrucomicrobiota bacterium]